MIPSVEDVAFRLRLSKSKAESLLSTLKTSSLIDGDRMHDWDDFQYSSDSSTERVKRHRERNMERFSNVSSNVSETVQSRTEQNRNRNITEEPPISPKGDDSGFESFWNAYPEGRKVGKKAALKAWKTLKPSKSLTDRIVKAITKQAANGHFKGSRGENFIPLPTTWLNQGRWDDQIQDPREKKIEELNLGGVKEWLEKTDLE